MLTGENEWTGWSPTWMLGHRIWGKRLGIIGMGRIGQAVARRARAFGLQIHYHNRRRLPEKIEEAHAATYWESLDQMLARMDIVSVNCPHTPATFHLLSARRLKLMKATAIIVNTARGAIVDVMVDIRRGSPSFGEWEAFLLDEDNMRSVSTSRSALMMPAVDAAMAPKLSIAPFGSPVLPEV